MEEARWGAVCLRNACTSAQDSGQKLAFEGKICSHSRAFTSTLLIIWLKPCYINGKQVPVPQGVGIASDQSCFYWLHTHTSDGVVHIEFPRNGSPTLGNFLDIWRQSFSQLGFHNELASSADWTVYVDGKKVTSDFNHLILQPHQVITIAYNSPNITPDTSFNWPAGE
jgi:hypothetical protein